MNREILDKKNSLYKESIHLRAMAMESKSKKADMLRKRQDEIFKRWEFYKNIIKANDKIKRDK